MKQDTQTTAYTQSVSHGCNQQVCNGLPLDQGGVWQFILANLCFSINSNGFLIFGYPGNPGTGGITNVVNNIPLPPTNANGSTGGEGILTFDWAAVNSDGSKHYTGHVVVSGHQVKHWGLHGSYNQLIVDDAQIFIDSVQ
jgi:hypothetical protein